VAGFYDCEAQKYENFVFEKPMEVLSLVGNVSLKDGQPFIHAHITLSDEKGQSFGGHLMEGTIVFAAEFIIEELEGENLEREFDKTTGLALWDI
jgi:predicted DNA-binding protein with PD1-like motif